MPPPPPRPPADRRSGKDRRRKELLPPGNPERRRSIEPRQPDVVELELSPSQWAELEQAALDKNRKGKPR